MKKIGEYIKGKGKKMNMVLAGLFVASVLVAASYVVSTATTTVTVQEAFTNKYAVVNGNSTNCPAIGSGAYTGSLDAIVGMPGDSKTVCVSVRNGASVSLPFNVSAVVVPAGVTISKELNCSGSIASSSTAICGIVNTINQDAAPMINAIESINVTRG